MLRVFRAFVVVTSFLLMGCAVWAETELIDNQFLQSWLAERGLWWFSYLPLLLAIVGLTTIIQALYRWPKIIEAVPLVSRGNNGTVPPAQQEVRLTHKGEVFQKYDEYPPELDKSREPVTLPTNSQGPSIGSMSGPGGSVAPVASADATKGVPAVAEPTTAGKPESDIVIPADSPLVKYALGVDKKYTLVQPEPGTPTLQRVRGVILRGKNTDDGRTNDSNSKVS